LILWLVTPCFFDAESFREMRDRARRAVRHHLPHLTPHFVVIDDSGGQDRHLHDLSNAPDTTVLVSQYNLGHQDAIVFSLRSMAAQLATEDFVITLDCDGEDIPEHIPLLIRALESAGTDLYAIALAQRTKRKESLAFKAFYLIFKAFFLALTGLTIRTGNYAAFRGSFARNTLFHPSFSYCYSSSLIAMPFKRVLVPLPRGQRYYGESKMRLMSLIGHGIRMLLPFSDRIALRSAMGAGLSVFILGTALLGMSALTLLLHYRIPQEIWLLTLFATTLAIIGALFSLLIFAIFYLNRATSMRYSRFNSLNPVSQIDSRAPRPAA